MTHEEWTRRALICIAASITVIAHVSNLHPDDKKEIENMVLALKDSEGTIKS